MAEYIFSEPLKKEIADFKRTVKCDNSDYLTGYICALSAVEGMIAEQPAADVEPVKRGVWELDYDRNFHRCSNCKESSIRYTDEWGYEIGEELTNFCPECGAKMDGGE